MFTISYIELIVLLLLLHFCWFWVVVVLVSLPGFLSFDLGCCNSWCILLGLLVDGLIIWVFVICFVWFGLLVFSVGVLYCYVCLDVSYSCLR